MSYYPMTTDMYRSPPPAVPGWQLAPVPGWGTNPDRSGPPRLALRGTDAEAKPLTEGHVAIGAAIGIAMGWLFASAYQKK